MIAEWDPSKAQSDTGIGRKTMDDRSRTVENDAAGAFLLREAEPSAEAKPDTEKGAPAAPESEPATRKSSPLRSAILIVLAAGIAFATYHFVTAERAPPSGPPRHAVAQPVGATTIALGDINVVVTGLGTVTPLANITVKTQVNGQLMEVAFTEGQIVKKGDLLAQIDPRPYQLAQAQYEGQLVHDQGLLDQARNDMTRYQTLLKQNSIARQTAEDQVYLVKQYEGSVKTDQAQIDTQKLNLTYARIVSPIDGRVGLRLVDPGNYVQTSDAGIAVLTQLHPISVIFTVPEDDIPQIMAQTKAGAPLEVTIYDRANINKLAVGKVMTIDNQIDTTTGTVKIRAEFQNLDDKLFPNQFVNARLLIRSLNGIVTAPVTAIQRGAPGTYVYLIGSDNKVSVRKIELGPQENGNVAVTSGLAPGDRVVVDGADRLREGASVFVAASDGVAMNASGAVDAAQGKHQRHPDAAAQAPRPPAGAP
ncbi:MdtA/MuxA family multidrug efflux RND transporter periplasmic adaptor subunit [Methylocella tundrae]|nr:MdtA/MuxA family multidrug efflux RND transporter periplasmic adaptor subunit [Methylocella tundrae]